MIRRSRDAKFVIYQVLYIFVITVLALKGAEINLGEVIDKDKVVEKSVRDSLINVVDSLSALGLKFNIEVDKSVISENKILKEQLSQLNTQVVSLKNKVKETPINTKKENNNISEIKKNLPSPFSTNKTFLKFARNTAENKGDFEVKIIDPANNSQIASIPANGKVDFELTNQDEVMIAFGNQKEKIKVIDNMPPEISIEKVTSKMNKTDIYVKELQRTTCFNVTISDERLEQIKIEHSGPISVTGPNNDNKGNLVYNVSLMLAANEDKFNDWADRNDHLVDSEGRFKTNFFFTAYDTKSKQKVEVGETFYFTEFTK
ncbi:MAG: hypothetical protein H6610_05085 [Ignavibacteriales bacterium]|nr:hypothetical protein [Ignavibacteriales bacterium]MCB9218815.1 hypothetical protein [Ignavibacteriales bacterium]